MFRNDLDLNDYLRGCTKGALDAVASLDADYLLSENEDVLVASLLQRHLPTPIAVDWSAASRSPITEVTLRKPDDFGLDRTYEIPASKVTVSFPVTGTTAMLGHRASTYTLSPTYGDVSATAVVLEVTERSLTPEVIRKEIDRVRSSVEQRVTWANNDLEQFAPQAERDLRASLKARRERILNDRAVEQALGIPVRMSGASRPPAPARRKQVSLPQRRQQAPFVPEPVLEEAIYRDVLATVRSWGTQMERTPRTASKLEEEELRDLLLGTLNGYWEGAAGGELFNGSGKTDILVREGDRNVFIAECKFWDGPKSASDALSQLLRYLVWRDSKAALVIFIKTAKPAATITKLHAAIEGHASHVITKDASDIATRADYIVTADDEGRRISLAVIPVVISSDQPAATE